MPDGYYTYHGDHFIRYVTAYPLCCTLETKTLYVNYNWKKNFKQERQSTKN